MLNSLRVALVILGSQFIAGSLLQHLAWAQSQGSVLSDRNDDGAVQALALGDSLTFGIGDGLPPGAEIESIEGPLSPQGFPVRVAEYLGIPVENAGIPGEELTGEGVGRVPAEMRKTRADVITLFWGANDAVKQVPLGEFRRQLQRALNVGRSLNKEVVLVTPPPPCCLRSGLKPFTSAYASVVRDVGAANDAAVYDLEQLWIRRCPRNDECPLLNRPEGLHPNTLGYDFIALGLTATVLDLRLTSPTDADNLAAATGLDPELVRRTIFGRSATPSQPSSQGDGSFVPY